MNKKLHYYLIILFLSISALISCRKESSCENCNDNKPPIAKAGRDTTIILPVDSIILDGSTSYDPDGSILNYSWSIISFSSSLTLQNQQNLKAVVRNLALGTFQFELKVTDDKNASARDTIVITVAPTAINHSPIANAGADQVIILPNNSVVLNGSGSTDIDKTLRTIHGQRSPDQRHSI